MVVSRLAKILRPGGINGVDFRGGISFWLHTWETDLKQHNKGKQRKRQYVSKRKNASSRIGTSQNKTPPKSNYRGSERGR